MLRYYRFHADLPHPLPARPTYVKRESGSGWPEHCPPIRAANAYGWDVINAFDMVFIRDSDGEWDIEEAVEVHSDIDLDGGITPHPQQNAWFWEKGQSRPHVITDDVYAAIRHQVKVSTFLFLESDPDEMLLMTAVPDVAGSRPWKVVPAVIECDSYSPAHPWHAVLELPRIEERPDISRVVIKEGATICRLLPIQRSDYAAEEMSGHHFGALFQRSQTWLSMHGRDLGEDNDVDITGEYARQQKRARFKVIPESQ